MKKAWKILIALLLVLTCVVAVVHIENQEEIACMVIRYDGYELSVDFAELYREEFRGELVNGKSERSAHTYIGISLRELLSSKNIPLSASSVITVTSADQYQASFTGAEILANGGVYAAVVVDGEAVEGIDPGTEGVQIVAFGDADSRRCVRFARILEITS